MAVPRTLLRWGGIDDTGLEKEVGVGGEIVEDDSDEIGRCNPAVVPGLTSNYLGAELLGCRCGRCARGAQVRLRPERPLYFSLGQGPRIGEIIY